MDGTLAVIWLVTSLTDMALHDCPTSCLRETTAPARLSFQLGEVQFQEVGIDREILIGRDSAMRYGPFHLTMAGSITGDGDAWVGAGAKWTTERVIDSPFYIETSLLPGIYAAGDGPDIGGALQFRSSLGAGYSFDNGSTISVQYDHRSNADTQPLNPGLETLSVRYAIAFD